MTRKYTHSEFVARLKSLDNTIEVLGEYVSSATKINVRCTVCSNEWFPTPCSLIQGHGCPRCRHKNKNKKTHEQFILELSNVNTNVEVLGVYDGADVKVKVRCLVDGHEWEPSASTLLNGVGCPKCAGRMKKTPEQFIEEVRKINPNIEIIGDYVNVDTKVNARCLVDGHEWSPFANNLLRGSGCPICGGKMKKTHEQFVTELLNINPDIEVLGEYVTRDTNITVRCRVDGRVWDTKPYKLLSGQRCLKCSGFMKKTDSEFAQELRNVNPNIEVIGEYVKATKRIKVRCLIDGQEWSTTPNSLLQGSGCPTCANTGFNQSKTAWFYVYTFQKYLGFGITNSPQTRHEKHRVSFEKSHIDFQLLQNIRYYGKDILELETHLKRILPIVDTKVPGFRTEAILYTDRELLYAELDKFKLIRGIL